MRNVAGFSFDRLIAPISRSIFLCDYYETAPLIMHRQDPGYYADLLTLERVWEHIETRSPSSTAIRLVKLDAPQNPRDYLTSGDRADPVRVAAMFADGWTISLSGMQLQISELGRLCAAAEAAFSQPFQANIYLTPPNAQGFMPHWDTHDVFVLQIHGSKAWTLYDTKIELPLPGQSFDDEKPPAGPVSAEFTLQAGDLLYCPRGLMHAAHSGPETSLHITFGLMGKTWSDLLLEAMSASVLSDPSLRRNLPFGFARADFDVESAHKMCTDLLQTMAAKADFAAAFARTRLAFVGSRIARRPGHAQQIQALDALTDADHAQARADLVWCISGDDETIEIDCGSSTITLPAFTREAIIAALNGQRFLIAKLPGALDAHGKLTLVRRLIREGLLIAVA